jgi:phosphoribosyl 1,2-cyclic phosphate phosphodiesterase
MFDPAINVEYSGAGRPYLSEVVPYFPLKIGALDVLPFNQHHGKMMSLGLRVGNFAYSTDVRDFPEKSFDLLHGLDVWIVDCNNEFDKDKSHSYLEQCLRWVDKLKPKKTYLTHLDYTMDYDTISAKLPKGVELAYDNLEIVL